MSIIVLRGCGARADKLVEFLIITDKSRYNQYGATVEQANLDIFNTLKLYYAQSSGAGKFRCNIRVRLVGQLVFTRRNPDAIVYHDCGTPDPRVAESLDPTHPCCQFRSTEELFANCPLTRVSCLNSITPGYNRNSNACYDSGSFSGLTYFLNGVAKDITLINVRAVCLLFEKWRIEFDDRHE